MISVKAKITDETKNVARRAKQGNFRSLGQAGAVIRLTAIRSIRKRRKSAKVEYERDSQGNLYVARDPGASQPGQPPRTRFGQLKNATAYEVDESRGTVVIGPKRSDIAEIGNVHEFGRSSFRGRSYKPRPFMRPAFEKQAGRLPDKWRGMLK